MEQRAHFTHKLEELKMQVLRMAAMSEKAVHNGIQAMEELDTNLAEEVINNDAEINELECHIDRFSLELLALGQPMARDLRFIVGCSRITLNLERIADEAANLAQRAIFLSSRPPLPFNQQMEQLAETAKTMLSDAVSSFVNEDVETASTVCVKDSEADEMHVSLLKGFIHQMVTESRIVERGVHHIMATRHLERVADLATNVAEAVIFIVEGEDVKHRCRG
jgi:phosphate transport system protein